MLVGRRGIFKRLVTGLENFILHRLHDLPDKVNGQNEIFNSQDLTPRLI
jgi:hypothetical protein